MVIKARGLPIDEHRGETSGEERASTDNEYNGMIATRPAISRVDTK